MPRPKRYPRSALARMTADELSQLHQRRRAAKLSLSRYLVEAGLSPASLPSPQAREQRERALFYLRKSSANLEHLVRALHRSGDVSLTGLEEALQAHCRATKAVAKAFEER